MTKRRIKVVKLQDYDLFVEMFYQEMDIFTVEVSDDRGPITSCVLFEDSFRHARQAFTNWIHEHYPKIRIAQ